MALLDNQEQSIISTPGDREFTRQSQTTHESS